MHVKWSNYFYNVLNTLGFEVSNNAPPTVTDTLQILNIKSCSLKEMLLHKSNKDLETRVPRWLTSLANLAGYALPAYTVLATSAYL